MLSSASPSYRVRIARDIIDGLRNKIVQGTTIQDLVALDTPEGPDFWGGLISAHHNELSHIGLRPVINASDWAKQFAAKRV